MKINDLFNELKDELENSPRAVFSNKRTVDIDIVQEIITLISKRRFPKRSGKRRR